MIYFDNAATTIIKPKSVYTAVAESIGNHGNPGRGIHRPALSASKALFSARLSTASFFGSSSPECVVFTQNATMSLNIAIKCFSASDKRILISDLEHNSVLRPVCSIKDKMGLYDVFETNLFDDGGTIESVKGKMTSDTGMVVLTHVSNVCGKILPVKEIITAVKKINPEVIVVLDVAQSAGTLEIDMVESGIDILCAPAHKGLLGIMGLGIIVFSNKLNVSMAKNFIEGGTGINSLETFMPDELPEKYESGTMNMPAIAALSASLEYLNSAGLNNILKAETALRDRLFDMLSENKKIKVYGGDSSQGFIGPLLFNIHNRKNDEISRFLEKRGIFTRSGYHCSPLAHKKLGTLDGGGIRVSMNFFNRKKEVDIFYRTLLDYVL